MAICVDWVLDARYLKIGIRHYIKYTGSHLGVVGRTGQGKTVALTLLLARIARYYPNARLFLIDYKNTSFRPLTGAKRYYSFNQCLGGMLAFDEAFKARQSGEDTSDSPLILCVDEWAAFLDSRLVEDNGKSDKERDTEVKMLKRMLSRWVMLSRELNGHICIGLQRADIKDYFTSGAARDQLDIMLMGEPRDDAAEMVFTKSQREELTSVSRIGEGHWLRNNELFHIQTPHIKNMTALVEEIRSIV